MEQARVSANWLSYPNATRLAKTITDYWAERGWRVKTSIDPVYPAEIAVKTDGSPTGVNTIIWQVRSDLKNGLPRGYNDSGHDEGAARRLRQL